MSRSRGLRNNNPGNIRISNTIYEGEITPSVDPEFKQFNDKKYGYRAMFMLLYTYQKRYGLNTIRGFINRWAPPVENHTSAYIDAVSEKSGVGPDMRVTATNRDVMIPIVAAMSYVENGKTASLNEIEAGWQLFINAAK